MMFFESDRKYITPSNTDCYCNTNAHLLAGAPRGIVLEFPGLGGGSCLGGTMELCRYEGGYAAKLADSGLLLAYTFPGPWSWMNRGAVRTTDLLLDALFDKYGSALDVVVTGGSMGGQGAIMFAARTRHKIRAAAAACPCFDVPEAVFVNPAFPRTFLSAAAVYDMPLDEALADMSPLHNMESLADIPYFITCDEADEIFPADKMHEFVKAMRARGLSVDYRVMPGLGHGGFTPEVREALTDFVIAQFAAQ